MNHQWDSDSLTRLHNTSLCDFRLVEVVRGSDSGCLRKNWSSVWWWATRLGRIKDLKARSVHRSLCAVLVLNRIRSFFPTGSIQGNFGVIQGKSIKKYACLEVLNCWLGAEFFVAEHSVLRWLCQWWRVCKPYYLGASRGVPSQMRWRFTENVIIISQFFFSAKPWVAS